MAYSRWYNSSWYIYWQASNATSKIEEKLRIIHSDDEGSGVSLNYSQVKKLMRGYKKGMASLRDPEMERLIPKFNHFSQDLFIECFASFLRDVDAHYEKKHNKASMRGSPIK